MQGPKEDGTGKLFRAGRRGLIDDVYGIVLLVLVQTRAPYLRRREAQLISRGANRAASQCGRDKLGVVGVCSSHLAAPAS